jgi:hypothetical protein
MRVFLKWCFKKVISRERLDRSSWSFLWIYISMSFIVKKEFQPKILNPRFSMDCLDWAKTHILSNFKASYFVSNIRKNSYLLNKKQINLLITTFAIQQSIFVENNREWCKVVTGTWWIGIDENSFYSVIEYSHLTSLDIAAANTGCVVQFLLKARTHLPRLTELKVDYH